jgi:hypothetical protein
VSFVERDHSIREKWVTSAYRGDFEHSGEIQRFRCPFLWSDELCKSLGRFGRGLSERRAPFCAEFMRASPEISYHLKGLTTSCVFTNLGATACMEVCVSVFQNFEFAIAMMLASLVHRGRARAALANLEPFDLPYLLT